MYTTLLRRCVLAEVWGWFYEPFETIFERIIFSPYLNHFFFTIEYIRIQLRASQCVSDISYSFSVIRDLFYVRWSRWFKCLIETWNKIKHSWIQNTHHRDLFYLTFRFFDSVLSFAKNLLRISQGAKTNISLKTHSDFNYVGCLLINKIFIHFWNVHSSIVILGF